MKSANCCGVEQGALNAKSDVYMQVQEHFENTVSMQTYLRLVETKKLRNTDIHHKKCFSMDSKNKKPV